MSDQYHKSGPYYQQVASILRAEIISIDSQISVRLPGEQELAETYQVARGTIRQALRVLADEGLIQRTQGRSTVTIPAGIRAWRQLHKSQIVKVLSETRSLPDIPASFYGQAYQGILSRSEEQGYQILWRRASQESGTGLLEAAPENPEHTIGVIIIHPMDERLVTMHTKAGYPVVCVDYWPADPLADGVIFDCYGEGQMAAQLLMSYGHRSVFYLGYGYSVPHIRGRLQHESDADICEAGLRRGLQEAGLSLPTRHVRFAAKHQGDAAVQWFLSLRPRPTAGLIFDRSQAEEFLRGLQQRGLSCPQDVSLVTRSPVGEPTQIVTLRNDPFRMGREAAGLLFERAAGIRQAGVRIVLASKLHHGPTIQSLIVAHPRS